MVSHVLEVNQDKFNKFTPGTNIPIISKAKLAKLEFDYFLVLPWHFKKFIVQKEKKNKSKLIFPLPNLHVI